MAAALDTLFAALIAVTVLLTALGIGLETSGAAIKEALGRRSLAALVTLNVVVVPLAGFLVVRLLPMGVESGTGVLLCSICAAGPLGLKVTQIARSDLAWALSSTVLLLPLNVISLPLWTAVLMDRSLSLHPRDLFEVMVVVVLVPFAVGALARRSGVAQTDQLSSWATWISSVTLGLAVAIGVAGNAPALAAALSSSVVVAATSVIVVCWLLSSMLPLKPSTRRTSTLITMNRATSVALLVVGRSFSDSGEMFTAVIVFGLVQTLCALGLSLFWGRRLGRSIPVPSV